MIYIWYSIVKFLVFVSEVVSIFSKILTWIIGGAKAYLCPTNSIIGGRVPRLPPKCTPMPIMILSSDVSGDSWVKTPWINKYINIIRAVTHRKYYHIQCPKKVPWTFLVMSLHRSLIPNT